jgi:hypothetical protein
VLVQPYVFGLLWATRWASAGGRGMALFEIIFFNFLVMNLFNKFSMLKKPNLSYILKLVEGDNYS